MTKRLPNNLETLLAQLEQAWDRQHGTEAAAATQFRRRSNVFDIRMRTLVRAGTVAAVAAAVAVVFLTRTSGPGAVAQAIAAAGETPAGSIVHFLSVSTDADGHLTQRTEMWAATEPPYAERSILQGADGAPVEQGATGDELTQYDPAGGVVYVRRTPGGIAAGNHPADFAPSAEQIKRYLSSNTTTDDGEVTVDGQLMHRFTIAPTGGGSCTYDVSADTFYARSFICRGLHGGSIDEHWGYLPRQDNEALLSVQGQHTDARIDAGPAEPCPPGPHTSATPPCIVSAPGG